MTLTDPPTPSELARAAASLRVATGASLAHTDYLDGRFRLTAAGLRALPALAALLDALVDDLVTEGHPGGEALLSLRTTTERAYAAARLLDADPQMAERLLAPQ